MPKIATAPVDIAAWLASLGYESDEARTTARAVLEREGLTNPRKRGMAPEKLSRARAALEAHLRPLCDSCAANLRRPDARTVVRTTQPYCETCAGSNNRRAAEALIKACLQSGVTRLLIVGGTGVTHRELQSLLEDSGLELRCIDGAERNPTKRDAAADLAWAQFMVIWGSTPLPHRVSEAYTGQRPSYLRSITVRRRGIEALCHEIITSLRGGRR